MVVLLPAPLGPNRPKISPLSMVNETSLTACCLPKVLSRCCTSTSIPLCDAFPVQVSRDVLSVSSIYECSLHIEGLCIVEIEKSIVLCGIQEEGWKDTFRSMSKVIVSKV